MIAAQPKYRRVVDIEAAAAEVGWLHELWALSRHAPTASPVSGGSLEWPKVLLQAFGVCHGEEQAISAWWQSEQAAKVVKEAGNG